MGLIKHSAFQLKAGIIDMLEKLLLAVVGNGVLSW